MANSYFGAGSKFSHPCYQIGQGYVCPGCEKAFRTCAPMEWHYLEEHNPTLEQAKEVCAPHRYGKHFQTQQWIKEKEAEKEYRRFAKAATRSGWAKSNFSNTLNGKMWFHPDYGYELESEVKKIINYTPSK